MSLRPVWHLAAVATAATVLIGFATPPTAGGELPAVLPTVLPAAAGDLPPCPAGPPDLDHSAAPPAGPPSAPPDIDHPAACRARPTRVEPAGAGRRPLPAPGYHHLGATTVAGWSGVLGRLTVRDPGVRRGSYDFVAARFLAKHRLGAGRIAWLEVGWTEPGWSGGGRQQIYTFDSDAMSWVFFDTYPIRAGDQIWVYLHSDTGADRTVWRAWLWWDERWQLLAAPALPVPARAQLEQYVEVHQDRPGPPIRVPPVAVDRVQVRDTPGAPLLPWRADRVPTTSPEASGDYCLSWHTRYDSWSAGDCPVTVQE